MHPLEQTTSFGIKLFRAYQYVGKSTWVKATENIKSTVQFLPNFYHIDHRRQSRCPFLSSTQSFPTYIHTFKRQHWLSFYQDHVKTTLHLIPQLSLSAYFSVSLPTLSPSLQSEKKTCSSFFPITIYFRSNILLSPWESSSLLYIFDFFTSVSSSDYKYASVFFRIRSLPQICHSPPVIQSSSFDYITSAKTSSTPSCLSSSQ